MKGCELYVADRYVGWQEATLNFLASQFDAKTRGFPSSWVKEVTEAVKASGQAGDMNDKALKQTVIPFAKVKVDEAQKGGAQVRAFFNSALALLLHSDQSTLSPCSNAHAVKHASYMTQQNFIMAACQVMWSVLAGAGAQAAL